MEKYRLKGPIVELVSISPDGQFVMIRKEGKNEVILVPKEQFEEEYEKVEPQSQ